MNDQQSVRLSLRRFLTTPNCPLDWRFYDLYVIGDEEIAFYVGQSECAFDRVWDHIKGGVHGHSIPGRFILANWPKSGSFVVEFLTSRHSRFSVLDDGSDEYERRNMAERALIEAYTPCLNISLNITPLPIPPGYVLPNAPIKWVHSYRRMMREAKYSIRMEENRRGWE